MMGLCFFKRVHAVRDNQHMKTCALKKGRKAICNGWVIIGKEKCGSVVWH